MLFDWEVVNGDGGSVFIVFVVRLAITYVALSSNSSPLFSLFFSFAFLHLILAGSEYGSSIFHIILI